jgi:two-component system cell cycle sensor histidine kinase/response regulator CckA
MMEELRRMLGRVIGAQVSLIYEPSESPALVSANRGELEQVIVNLVVNSRDAMPDGGRIVIRVSTLEVDRDDGFSPAGFVIPPGRYVLIEVSDTGTGIPSRVREHVFEPFFSTKSPGEGTGLGLSTAYGIVRQHGGHIWFDTASGGGTIFHIVLPEAGGG